MSNWLDGINSDELQFIATSLSVFNSGSEKDTESAASFMYKEGYARPMNSPKRDKRTMGLIKKEIDSRPPKSYWEHVKKEIYTLVCSADEKYIQPKSCNEHFGFSSLRFFA